MNAIFALLAANMLGRKACVSRSTHELLTANDLLKKSQAVVVGLSLSGWNMIPAMLSKRSTGQSPKLLLNSDIEYVDVISTWK